MRLILHCIQFSKLYLKTIFNFIYTKVETHRINNSRVLIGNRYCYLCSHIMRNILCFDLLVIKWQTSAVFFNKKTTENYNSKSSRYSINTIFYLLNFYLINVKLLLILNFPSRTHTAMCAWYRTYTQHIYTYQFSRFH